MSTNQQTDSTNEIDDVVHTLVPERTIITSNKDDDVVDDDAYGDDQTLCHDFAVKATIHHETNSNITSSTEKTLSRHISNIQQDFNTNNIPDQINIHRCTYKNQNNNNNIHFICDLGYGLPKEHRPKKEKILAIARQLMNFIIWQQEQQQQIEHTKHRCNNQHFPTADIYIILGQSKTVSSAKTDEDKNMTQLQGNYRNTTQQQDYEQIRNILLDRMYEIWDQHHSCSVTNTNDNHSSNCVTHTNNNSFPNDSIIFIFDPIEIFLRQREIDIFNANTCYNHIHHHPKNLVNNIVYLSPDATTILDISNVPPKYIIIGLLIDRRTIQVNRSKQRADQINIPTVRWPIEQISTLLSSNIHKNEPFNVDCILEGMQQWYWNILSLRETISETQLQNESLYDIRAAFEMAATQAIAHHRLRHPQRPIHISTEKTY